MPLNGRQFANLAATLPGVGLGNHSDPTKSTQYSPQINGGNGRNVNYQIDGGDNNDDTVGGLLQLFPLEAIQEFNFVTSRAKAENGRSNGGVMNIVTKSGTNNMRGSFFTLFRDDVDEREDRRPRSSNNSDEAGLPPLSVRRQLRRADHQGQGCTTSARSSGRSRTPSRSSTRRARSPQEDGIYATPYRETLLNVKVTANLNASQLPVGPLRPQRELAAVRRGLRPPAEQLGRQHQRRSTRSTSTTTGCSAAAS